MTAETTHRCTGCSHVPHDSKDCGAWAYTESSNRCGCTYDRSQTYEVRRGN